MVYALSVDCCENTADTPHPTPTPHPDRFDRAHRTAPGSPRSFGGDMRRHHAARGTPTCSAQSRNVRMIIRLNTGRQRSSHSPWPWRTAYQLCTTRRGPGRARRERDSGLRSVSRFHTAPGDATAGRAEPPVTTRPRQERRATPTARRLESEFLNDITTPPPTDHDHRSTAPGFTTRQNRRPHRVNTPGGAWPPPRPPIRVRAALPRLTHTALRTRGATRELTALSRASTRNE